MSIEELVTDLRARINDVVGSGWLSMTLGMVGFFGVYYVLFVLIMRETGVTLPLNLLFAAFAIGRLLTAVGITPGGIGITETATSAVLVGWGAEAAGATAGVVLFSIFTHLMEVPLGALGWLLWTASTKVEPHDDGDEPAWLAPDRHLTAGGRGQSSRRKTIAIGVCSLPWPSGLSANISSKRAQSPGTSEPSTLRPMSLASMTTVPPKVERHGSGTRCADRGRQARRDGIGVLGRELGRHVGRVGRVLGRAVDGVDVVADELVEQALAAEHLADGAAGRGVEHPRQAGLLDGQLHRERAAQADAGRGARDVAATARAPDGRP